MILTNCAPTDQAARLASKCHRSKCHKRRAVGSRWCPKHQRNDDLAKVEPRDDPPPRRQAAEQPRNYRVKKLEEFGAEEGGKSPPKRHKKWAEIPDSDDEPELTLTSKSTKVAPASRPLSIARSKKPAPEGGNDNEDADDSGSDWSDRTFEEESTSSEDSGGSDLSADVKTLSDSPK